MMAKVFDVPVEKPVESPVDPVLPVVNYEHPGDIRSPASAEEDK